MSDSLKNIPVGIKIAAAAVARQQGLNRKEYAQLCQKLLRQTVQSQTHNLDKYFGNSAKSTKNNFQKAGIGEPYRDPSQLKPGDLAYSDEGSPQYGHAMLVGPDRALYDQVGHGSPQTAGFRHPTWIVHPDSAIAAYNKARNTGSTHVQARSQVSSLASQSNTGKASYSAPSSPMPTPIPGAERNQLSQWGGSKGTRQAANEEALAQLISEQTPQAQSFAIPQQNIPFSQPPAMPNNIPSYVPQTYNPEQGMDVNEGVNFGVPGSLDPNYQSSQVDWSQAGNLPESFSAVPQGSYADFSTPANVLGSLSEPVGPESNFNPEQQAIFDQFGPAPYGLDFSPESADALNAQLGDQSAIANFGQGDQEPGSSESLYGDPYVVSGSDSLAIQGENPMAHADSASLGDFNAANQQFGEGNWYYDENGNPVGSETSSPQIAQQQSATGGPTQGGAGQLPSITTGTPGSTGVFNMGTWVPAGSTYAKSFNGAPGTTGSSYSITGVPGSYQTTPSGQTFSTAVGFSMAPLEGGTPPGAGGAGGRGLAVSESAGTAADLAEAKTVNKQFGGDWDAYEAYQASRPQIDNPTNYATGWDFQKGFSGGSYGGGHPGAGWYGPGQDPFTGHYVATGYSTDPSLAVPMPTSKPGAQPPPLTHAKTGKAIMARKSGKVPGTDHGRDEILAMLEPGEIVVNRSQMRGLTIKNPKLLRADQKRAIKKAA